MKTFFFFLFLITCTAFLSAQTVLEPFEKNGKWGYKNLVTDEIVISPEYDQVTSFEKTKFALIKKSGKWGCINLNGELVVKPRYDSLMWQSDYLFAQDQRKWGVLNTSEKIIVPIKFDDLKNIFSFGPSYADPSKTEEKKERLYKVALDYKWGVFGEEQGMVLPTAFKEIEYPYYLYESKLLRERAIDIEKSIVFYKNKSNSQFNRINLESFLITESEKGKELYSTQGKLIYSFEGGALENAYLFEMFNDTLFIVSKDNKFGMFDGSGKVIAPIEYDALINKPFSNAFWALKQDKWGLIGSKGQIIQPFIFAEQDGQIVKLDDHYGVLNFTFEDFIYPPVFDTIFRDDKDYIYMKHLGKYGVVNSTCDTILPFEFEDIRPTKQDNYIIYSVKKDGKWGLLGGNKQWIIPPHYDFIKSVNNIYVVQKDEKWGVVNKENEILLPIEYDEIKENQVRKGDKWGQMDYYMKELMIPVEYNEIYRNSVRNGSKWGLYNVKEKRIALPIEYDSISQRGMVVYLDGKQGRFSIKKEAFIIPVIYDDTEFVHLADTKQYYKVKLNGKWGVTDLNHQLLLPIEYDEIELYFYFTRARIGEEWLDNVELQIPEKDTPKYDNIETSIYHLPLLEKNDKWALANADTTLLTDFIYEDIDAFAGGNLYEVRLNGKAGLIDRAAKEILPIEYEKIYDPYNGTHKNGKQKPGYNSIVKNSKMGVINQKAQIILPPLYDQVKLNQIEDTTFWVVKMDGKWGVTNNEKQLIISCTYDDITAFPSRGYFKLRKEGKYGLSNKKGTEITPPTYDEIEIDYDFIHFRKDTLWGILDEKGKEIIPAEYDMKVRRYNDTNLYSAKKKGKYGLVAPQNKPVLDFVFSFPINVINGIVYSYEKEKKYDTQGNILENIPYEPPYIAIEEAGKDTLKYRTFSKGIKAFSTSSDLYGIKDSTGKVIVPPTFNHIKKIDSDFIRANKKGFETGLLDLQTLELLFINRFQEQTNLPSPIRWVIINDYYEFINANLKVITNGKFDRVGRYFLEGLIAVEKDQKIGFLNAEGVMEIPFLFDADLSHEPLFRFINGIAFVYKNGKYGFINKKGDVIKPFVYEIIYSHERDKSLARKDGEWEIIYWK